MKGKEANIVREYMCEVRGKSKVKFIRNDFFGDKKGLVDSPVAPGTLCKVADMVVVNGEVGEIGDFYVSNFIIIDVILVNLFADDKQPHEIFFLDHDFHLV